MSHPPLLVLVGPTAVGKTELSLQLATRFDGEIISADSRLFYRGMDIGTAKPSAEEQARLPHHLIDICTPAETLTLGEYQRRAVQLIDACHARGKLPILVGGTGQYVKAVVEGWGIPEVAPQPALRGLLEEMGKAENGRWLATLDPVTHTKIDLNNQRRLVRALEVTLVKGVPISTQQTKTPPPYHILTLGLQRERAALYARIDARVDQMLGSGLLKEVEGLLAAGYSWELPALSGLGYRQLRPYFEGNATLQEVSERIKFETHRFARQQKTWFQPHDPTITWLDAADPALVETAVAVVHNWLTNR